MAKDFRDFSAGLRRRVKEKAAEFVRERVSEAPPVEGEPAWKSSLPWRDEDPDTLVVTLSYSPSSRPKRGLNKIDSQDGCRNERSP